MKNNRQTHGGIKSCCPQPPYKVYCARGVWHWISERTCEESAGRCGGVLSARALACEEHLAPATRAPHACQVRASRGGSRGAQRSQDEDLWRG
eukprot:3483740-Rhodomonas_salina.2